MTNLYTFETLIGWVDHLNSKYEGYNPQQIASAEKIHLMVEEIGEKSYEWVTVHKTVVLFLNSTLSEDEQRKWLIGALADKYFSEGKKVMIRISKN